MNGWVRSASALKFFAYILVGSTLLTSCTDAKTWSEDEIRDIAGDVSPDTSVLESRIAELETNNEQLAGLVKDQSRMIEIQSQQIDALNDSVSTIERYLRR